MSGRPKTSPWSSEKNIYTRSRNQPKIMAGRGGSTRRHSVGSRSDKREECEIQVQGQDPKGIVHYIQKVTSSPKITMTKNLPGEHLPSEEEGISQESKKRKKDSCPKCKKQLDEEEVVVNCDICKYPSCFDCSSLPEVLLSLAKKHPYQAKVSAGCVTVVKLDCHV